MSSIALPPPSTVPELALAKWVRSLFLTGEQGAWYDPSDMSTLFQDAAGTVPVTAVEQPVGRILDKSGRGNHATQTTPNSRPVLSARYNLLGNTEVFLSGSWTKNSSLIAENAATAPNGTATADKLIAANGLGYHFVSHAVITVPAASYKLSCYAKSGEYGFLFFSVGGPYQYQMFDLTTGAVGALAPGFTSAAIKPEVGGWFRCEATYTAVGTANSPYIYAAGTLVPEGTNGDGTSGIYIWGAQLTVTNSLPSNRYQRVNTSSDYDAVGFRPYLRFDGVDDFLVTPSINFTGTDKMTVFAGVRKLSDSAIGVIAELGANAASLPGCFYLIGPGSNTAPSYQFNARGAGNGTATVGGFPSPNTAILTCLADISGDVSTLKVNGGSGITSTADQGTGTYGNYPLYIGRRGGTSLPFNGHLYSLIIRGAQSSDAQIRAAEAWVNNRTGAY